MGRHDIGPIPINLILMFAEHDWDGPKYSMPQVSFEFLQIASLSRRRHGFDSRTGGQQLQWSICYTSGPIMDRPALTPHSTYDHHNLHFFPLVTVIVTVAGVLSTVPSFTTSFTVYVPALSALKDGKADVAALSTALL